VRRRFLFRGLTVVLSLVISVGLAEGVLALLAEVDKKVPDYGDTWREDGLGPGGFLKSDLDLEVRDGYSGKVHWRTNSAGFRSDHDVSRAPAPGTLRILSLGDSFTAGARIDQEATYSRLLEKELQARGVQAEVLIGCTEEPVQALTYLLRYGLDWNPDAVLLGLTLGNDVAQAYLSLDPRGSHVLHDTTDTVSIETRDPELGFTHGLETLLIPESALRPWAWSDQVRWQVDHVVKQIRLIQMVFRPSYPIMSWYTEYRHPKLLDPTNGLGIFLADPPPAVDEAYRRTFRTLEAMDRICRQRGVRFAVLLLPQRFQVQPEDWQLAVWAYRLREDAFDLEAPGRRLGRFCATTGIEMIDPTPNMRAARARTGTQLYLPIGNMHWNAEGNRALFEACFDSVLVWLQR